MTNNNVLFCDVESNGLRGEAFAAALVDQNGKTIFNGYYRHDVLSDPESWVAQNVKVSGEEYASRQEFLTAFLEAYEGCRAEYGFGDYGSLAICGHMPAPVESGFFNQLFTEAGMGEFSGPYHMLATDTLMWALGEQADSEQAYADKFGIELPDGYIPHSALADAQLTRLVWNHLTGRIS